MSLDGLREQRQRPPHGWAGTILDDATTLQDEVRVLLDAFRDSRRPHGPMPFLPGSVLPNEGDRCLIMFDEARRGRIVWWGTEDSLPGGGGSSPPWTISDTTGLQAALDAKASAATLSAHTADAALDGGPHGFPALGSDGLGWLRVGGALVAVDLATQAEVDAALAGKQPLDTDLTQIAALTSAADKVPYSTGAGTWAMADFTAAARALLDDANATAMRTTLGLAIGTDVQAFDAQLAAIAGLTPAADQVIYWTGPTAAAMTGLTAAGRALVDDADAAAQRTTLDVPSNALFNALLATPRLLGRGSLTASGFTGAAKYILLNDGTWIASGTDTNKAAGELFQFDPADYAITGKTLKVRVRARVRMGLTNALGAGVTLKVHVASLTHSNGGAANTIKYTFGTSRMSATSAANLAANSETTLDIAATDASGWAAGLHAIWWEVIGGTPGGVGICSAEAWAQWT